MGSGHHHHGGLHDDRQDGDAASSNGDRGDDLVDAVAAKRLWIAVVACGVLVLLGVIVWWPGGDDTTLDPSGLAGAPIAALVTDAALEPCSYDPILSCRMIEVTVHGGELDGEVYRFEESLSSPIRDGDRILVDVFELPDGTSTVSFYDFQRSTPMLLLTLLFVGAIVLFGRWRGVGALVGLAASLAVILGWTLPALLDGGDAVAVAVISASAIAFVALFSAHGIHPTTAAALLSTLLSLALTGLLGWIFVGGTKLTGLADEEVGYLDALGSGLDPKGLLLAGLVIGALGVLDDVTVTQVSAVWELRRALPDASFGEVYHRAVRIGRDHISSTVNTLFLAYAGAALPLLLLFREAQQSLGSVATREVVAVEIVRALVGSIGLVASVPISTALAAAVLTRRTDSVAPRVSAPS